ncbi:MAG TPA: hypothetical protein VKD72_06890 [Gemmataceae bacterium]|nr:hypothetical protein [Gemmataceae bacterium]
MTPRAESAFVAGTDEHRPAANVAAIEAVVVKHLRQRCSIPIVPEGPPRRGVAQRRQRDHEQQARLHAVAVGEQIAAEGRRWSQAF